MKIIKTENPASGFIDAALRARPILRPDIQPKDGFEIMQKKASAPSLYPLLNINLIYSLFNNNINSYKSLGGGENFVYLINNQWVFRIPKQDDAKNANRREQILLKELNNYVKSTQIPAYKFWDYEKGVGAYQEIKGIALSYKFYNNLNCSEKSLFAHDLALAISEIHDVPRKNTPFLNICTPEAKEYIKLADSCLGPQSVFSKQEVLKIKKALRIIELTISKPDAQLVVLHSDLHCDNILVDPKTKKLSGLIDFSDARIGFAVIDFANLYRVSPQLAEEAAQVYAREKNINAQDFIEECRAWSIVWQAACIARNYHGKTLREEKRVIRSGRALNYLLRLI